MMRLKKRPVTPVGLIDIEFEFGALKRPPGILTGSGVKPPVRLQVLQYIVMTSEDQALAGSGSPETFGECHGADPCNLPVKRAGKLVNDYPLRRRGYQPGKPGAELLAAAKHPKRAKPCGNVPQPDRRQRSGNGVKITIRCDCVNNGRIIRPAGSKVYRSTSRSEIAADRALTRPGRADNHANPPRAIIRRKLGSQIKITPRFRVEHAFYARRPVAGKVGTPIVNFYCNHTVTTFILQSGKADKASLYTRSCSASVGQTITTPNCSRYTLPRRSASVTGLLKRKLLFLC